MIGGGPKRPWWFSLRLHRLESLCYQLTAKWYERFFTPLHSVQNDNFQYQTELLWAMAITENSGGGKNGGQDPEALTLKMTWDKLSDLYQVLLKLL